jgi:calmodulin
MGDREHEQMMDLKEAFDLFDKDKDGRITGVELKTVMQSLGQQPTDAEIADMINEVDVDGNGTIEFSEFIAMMEKKLSALDPQTVNDEMYQAFKVFDKDGNGFICREELKEAMQNLGEQLCDNDIDEMIAEADLDKNGLIDYQEFICMMAPKT